MIEKDDRQKEQNDELFTKEEVQLLNAMRSLWEEHVAWTRMTIISMVADLPDQEFVIRRLLRNANDMGGALRPFYGDRTATEFTRLMREHLLIAVQLVEAAKAGDAKVIDKTRRRWYRNADEIAAFLSSINPNWSESMLREMLYDHLALTEAEAVAQISAKYSRSIALYDKIEKQALQMADALTAGIVMQFPNIFAG